MTLLALKNYQRQSSSMYQLPQEKIATEPLPRRDDSKLLVYRDGEISDAIYRNLSEYLSPGTVLVRNTSRVLPARIAVGGGEVFLVSPAGNSSYEFELGRFGASHWRVMIGKISPGVYDIGSVRITISPSDSTRQYRADFLWPDDRTFSEVLESIGTTPLPPYMNREAVDADSDRYQTVFANAVGSVAAPTAGLHMTPRVLQSLVEKGVQIVDVVLHVGLGTFLPVKGDITEHQMHSEYFEVPRDTYKAITAARVQGKPVVALGTTAFRTLESLPWATLKGDHTVTDQWTWKDPEQQNRDWQGPMDAYFGAHEILVGTTRLMAVPGYEPRIVDGLLTNFHQPDSTLIQLVAAFIGDDWKRVYQHALDNNYRFLS